MFKPWISVPAEDIRVQLPMGIYESDVHIMFKDAKVIDNVIEQLEALKEVIEEGNGYV